jgi:predicted lipoprotein
VLRGLVNEVVGPDLLEVERRSRDLPWAARRLLTAPAEAELIALRAAWRRAALAWKRASAFRAGPLLTTQALTRASYWPARTAAIREVLAAERAPSVAELGADVKGLYALEYLLFDQDGEPAAWERLSSGPLAPRARELSCAYADDISAHGESVRNSLVGAQSFATELVHGGQQSINSLVSLLAESVENLLAARFSLALWLASLQRLRPADLEGGPSRISHELSLALLTGSQRLYLGGGSGGLSELVERAAPAIHRRLVQLFAAAVSSLKACAAPIEQVALSDRKRVEAALGAAKALESALKNDLSSALGVTLAFTALDAD